MSEEPLYAFSRDGHEIGQFTKWELMKDYNSREKCERFVVVVDGTMMDLWRAICKWHGAVKFEDAIVSYAEFRERFGDEAFMDAFGKKLFEKEFGS